MATFKPELHSSEAVISFYEDNELPMFRVYAGHKEVQENLRYTYTGNDKLIGRDKLHEALQSVLSNPDNTNPYMIQILRQKGKGVEAESSITFQLNRTQPYVPYQGSQVGYVNNELMQKLTAMQSQMNALQMQLNQQDDEEEEEDEQPQEKNFLSGLMQHPQIQNMILASLSNLLQPTQKVTHVAGVIDETSQDEKINHAIAVLKQYDNQLGDDLLLLCELAQNDKMQFNFLLKMLRK